ncbi:pilus assembly protein PilM [Patescibacteria group bacterium]|nr:pilus assembly protein PilM [Patescibacteria group bacterium]
MLFRAPPFGLNISDYSIETISLGGSIKNPRLLALGRKILEPGTIEYGKILKPERLESVLQKLIEKPKFGKINTKKFIFTLPESKTFIHIVELPPDLKKEKTEEFIRSEAVSNFPFSLSDIYFGFKIVNREVFLAAVQKNIVNEYLRVFKNLKLKPIVLEIESTSIFRALTKKEDEAILITGIGARTTNINIFDEGYLRLSISIDTAGNKFSQVLVKKLNISFQEAESLKKEIGLDHEKKEGKVFLILQKEIQEIIFEIKKTEDYFRNKTGKKIEKIILAGGSAPIPHLRQYLEENLEQPVLIGDPWENINIDILKKKEYFKKALEINPILYAPAIGSALRGLTRRPEKADINLLPRT